jgi:hypothetical protein
MELKTIIEEIIAKLQTLMGGMEDASEEIIEAENPAEIDAVAEKVDDMEGQTEKAEDELETAEKAIVAKMEESDGANADAEEILDVNQPAENEVEPEVLSTLEKARTLLVTLKTATSYTKKLLKSKSKGAKVALKLEEKQTKKTILKLENEVKTLSAKLDEMNLRLEKSISSSKKVLDEKKQNLLGQRELAEALEKSVYGEKATLRSDMGKTVLKQHINLRGGKVNG